MTNEILQEMFNLRELSITEETKKIIQNINLNISNEELKDVLSFVIGFYDIKIKDNFVYINRNKWAEITMKIAKLIDCYIETEKSYMRLKYDLPKTKELIYWDINKNKHKVIRVVTYEKHKSYDTLKITLENGEEHLIYDAYFKEMQDINFSN